MLELAIVLFIFRLTYLISRDIIFQPVRNAALDRGWYTLLDLVECMWCAGTYTAIVGSLAYWALAGSATLLEVVTLGLIMSVVNGLGGALVRFLEK